MNVEEKSREIYDSVVTELIRQQGENSEAKFHKQALKTFAKKVEKHPGVKGWIYAKTLEWVNDVRENEMGLEPTDELVQGNELESNTCTIAATLDTLYATAVGDNDIAILRDVVDEYGHEYDFIYVDGVPSGEIGQWYASWCRLDDPHNKDHQGWAKLPWYAWMVANAFDYGAFPELKL
jgi:hypothetical protein